MSDVGLIGSRVVGAWLPMRPARLACRALLLTLALSTSVQADERRQAGEDTARHPALTEHPAAPRGGMQAPAPGRLPTPAVRGGEPTLLEDIDPAVRQYWSGKCTQQRARGWGHTGDCKHPAYSGGYYGPAPLVVVPYGDAAQPRSHRRPGHLGIQPPRPEGRGHLR